jgi:hypothetical protein
MDSSLLPIAGGLLVAVAIGWMLWPKSSSKSIVDIHGLLSQLIDAAPNQKSQQLLREAGIGVHWN